MGFSFCSVNLNGFVHRTDWSRGRVHDTRVKCHMCCASTRINIKTHISRTLHNDFKIDFSKKNFLDMIFKKKPNYPFCVMLL